MYRNLSVSISPQSHKIVPAPPQTLASLAIVLLCAFLAACGSGSGGVSTISVTPAQPSVAVSGSVNFTASLFRGNGQPAKNATFTWSSSATNVATIDASSGAAHALLPGTTQVTASANGVTSASVTLTVTPGFAPTGSLPGSLEVGTATTLNDGTVLIVGRDTAAPAQIYNPATATFTSTGALLASRAAFTATLLNNGKVLIAGGFAPMNGTTTSPLASAELYDPASGTFTLTGSMFTARWGHTATLLPSGKVLIASGFFTPTAELYDPVTEIFSTTGSMNTSRGSGTATLLNDGKVLCAAGLGLNGYLSSAELYDPLTGSFSFTGSLSTARDAFTATLLNNGMVLIAAGLDNQLAPPAGPILSAAELYNPVTGTFTQTGSLSTPRFDHSATLLNNGTVMIAGGDNSSAAGATSTAEIYDPSTGAFTVTGSLTAARFIQTSTLLNNGSVLIAGGLDASESSLSAAELYLPATFTPSGLQSITVNPTTSTIPPGAYQRFAAQGTFAAGTQQLASVTWKSAVTTTAQISNDASNPGAAVAEPSSPTTLSPVSMTAAAGTVTGSATLNLRPSGFIATGSMTLPRESISPVVLNSGLVLVMNGDTGIGTPGPAELYNPATGTFSETGSPVQKRFDFTATVLKNGMVLIAGGFTTNALAAAELFNPATGTFSSTGPLVTARYDHTATLLENGRVLIAGGRANSNTELASAELYDPATGTFSATGSLSFARGSHTATEVVGGSVLMVGGQGTGGLDVATAEIYNPTSGAFTTTGSLHTAREFHTATLLNTGLVLIAGGDDDTAITGSAELYDPNTGLFTNTGNLLTARFFHTATLLNTGQVFVAGGLTSTGALASAELFNPATGSFTAAGTLITGRASHGAVLLQSGIVLLMGGANATVLSSAELY